MIARNGRSLTVAVRMSDVHGMHRGSERLSRLDGQMTSAPNHPRHTRVMVFRWAIAFAILAPAALGQTPCANTPACSLCEMTFELPANPHPNPYATVDLRVEFRSPRRRTYAMPAFWDGARRMVVRFSPTEPGAWDYHVTSNAAEWNDKTGAFTAAASEAPGFLLPANVHHWMYTEKSATGLYQAHLWMGATESAFATMDDAAFRTLADARAAQKFTHLRGIVLADASAYANG